MKTSIIIPVFNEEKSIKEAIDSLLKQTEKDFEIIIVDDGSKDNTQKIVKEIKSKKINLILGEHKGPGFSRNLGSKFAKGKFLVFVDADMTFDKDYLKNLINPMIKNPTIIGTTHDYEIAVNTKNKISELWGKIRVNEKEGYGKSAIFRAIRKNYFLNSGGFNPKYGYADDQTFYLERGIVPYVAKKTICYHRNPETLEETYKQARWIGASWKERFLVFKIPILKYFSLMMFRILINFFIIKKSKNILERKFHRAKFYGYYEGVKEAILKNNVIK